MTLRLLTLPVSTNHLYGQRSGRRFLNDRARRNKEQIGWEVRTQYRGKPLEGPLRAEIGLYWGDKRRHDVDNIKGLLDALTGILWLDDDQITELTIRKDYDKKEPRVEMRVEHANRA